MRRFRYRPAAGRVSRARSLALVLSLSFSPSLSGTFSLALFLSVSPCLTRVRTDLRPFSSTLSFSLPLNSRSFSRSLPRSTLSLSLSFHLVLAIGLGGHDRARPTPFSSLSLSHSVSLFLPFVNSLAAISPAVLVAQERVEPIMSPRAPWLELFDPIPAAGVPRRAAVS